MRRSDLRVFAYVRFTVECWFRSPLLIASVSLSAALSCLGFLASSSSGKISPAAFAVSWALPLLAAPWIVQSMTARLWNKHNPHDWVSIEDQLRGGWRRFWAALASLGFTMLLAPLGLLFFGFGLLAALALGIWRTILVAFSQARGRDAFDQAWELSGAGGLLWCVVSLAGGLLIGTVAASVLFPIVGSASLVMVGPITVGVGLSLTTAALLDRLAD